MRTDRFRFAATMVAWAGFALASTAEAGVLVGTRYDSPQVSQSKPERDRTNLMEIEPSADDMQGALSSPKPGPVRARGLSAMAIDVGFAFNSAVLTPAAEEMLVRLATAMSSEELFAFFFLIEGHTDSVGAEDYNLGLSLRRAQAVQEFLVTSLGITPERLLVEGKGETELLDPANPRNGINRRVEVVNFGRFN